MIIFIMPNTNLVYFINQSNFIFSWQAYKLKIMIHFFVGHNKFNKNNPFYVRI